MKKLAAEDSSTLKKEGTVAILFDFAFAYIISKINDATFGLNDVTTIFTSLLFGLFIVIEI